MTLDSSGKHIPGSPTTDEGGGTAQLPSFLAAAVPTATAAGSGETIDQRGVVFDPVHQFYDPSKYGKVYDSRFVPGMGTATGSLSSLLSNNTGNPNGMPFVNTTQTTDNGPYISPDGSYGADTPPTTTTTVTPGPAQPVNTQGGTTLATAMNNLLDMGNNADPAAIQQLQDRLIKGGYLDPSKTGYNPGTLSGTKDPTYSAYYQLLTGAIKTGTNVWSILDDRVQRDAGAKYEKVAAEKQAKADAAAKRASDLAAKEAAAQARALLPSQVNRTTTNISDPVTAQGLLTPVLTNALGRPPTTEDISNFTTALQQAQAASPTLTTGTASPAVDGGGDKTTTTTGGFDPSQFTSNYVNQHYGKEEAAVGETTSFYNAALQALSSSGGR